jgi:uncharacterized protein (DUF1501 family)
MALPHRNCIACRVKQCRAQAIEKIKAMQMQLTRSERRRAPAPPKPEPEAEALPSRRAFLKGLASVGAIGVSRALFPAWMPRLAFRPPEARASTGRGDVLVVVFLRGGIDGLSAIVPHGEGALYYDKRRTQGVQNPIDLDGFFGLHPGLSPLLDMYQARDLAIVHAAGSIDPSRSHFDAMQFMEHGTPGNKNTPNGWIGRHLEAAAWTNESPFRAVGMGAMAPTSLRGTVAPLALRSIGDFHLRGRADQLNAANAALASLYGTSAPADLMSAQARLVFETIEMLETLNAETYVPAHGAVYPGDDEGFGMGLRQIAQLIKADVGLEVATIDLGGWDTHENQGTNDGFFNAHLNTFARGLAAFHADLRDHIGHVTLVTMSEFGRRATENASGGTDHGRGNFMMLMGGGVQGGRVVADWPTLHPDRLNDGDLEITIDYRDVLSEVLRGRVGASALDYVFPGFTPSPRGLIIPRA